MVALLKQLRFCQPESRFNHYPRTECSFTPNPPLKLTSYDSRRLAAPGASGIMPSVANRGLPPRAA